jgi:hypothetical protein
MTLLHSSTVLLLLLIFASSCAAATVPLPDKTVTSIATLISSYSAFRNFLSCTNNDSAVAVRWGSAIVTATRGQRVPGGAHIEIHSPDAIYMISEGADVIMSCTEETR